MQLSLLLLLLHLWGSVDVSSSQNACSTLPDVANAKVSELTLKPQYHEGDVLDFTCETGFTSLETPRYVCTRASWLTVRQGACYSCATLPHVPHAFVSAQYNKPEYFLGDVIQFTCEGGFTSSVAIAYVCVNKGWLAVSQGTCYSPAARCERPPADGGLSVTGLPGNNELMFPDHILTFSCDHGKQLSGSSVLVCGKDGQWTSPFPSCQDITCKVQELTCNMNALSFPANKTVVVGHSIQFYCDNNFELRGQDEITCLKTGEWDHPFPTCSAPPGPARCGKPPILLDGDTEGTVKSIYAHNERVKYICQALYTMDGDPYKTCISGQWRGNPRCLKPCTINEELTKKHNIEFRYTYQKKLYVPHLEKIEFRCVRGTSLVHSVNMRQECIDGEMQLPTCQ